MHMFSYSRRSYAFGTCYLSSLDNYNDWSNIVHNNVYISFQEIGDNSG